VSVSGNHTPVAANGRATERAARVIALYLPQFHPVPENDEWWGPGFSEWTNVASARPLYPGHRQPRIPADLGFYDLRVPEARSAQAELAARHGIEAFCYWHYWFAGRRMLERPFREVLERGEPGFGFCLAWANQSWTTFWTGDKRTVLIPQTYPGPDDDERHFYEVLPAFRDPRYFCVDGRPLFMVYRPNELPDASAFADQWRRLADKEGLPGLYLMGEQKSGWRAASSGFDADMLPGIYDVAPRPLLPGRLGALLGRLPRRRPNIARYEELARRSRVPSRLPHPELPVVVSNWDNTPRSGRRGLVLEGSTPKLFGESARDAVRAVQDLPPEQRIVIVKSWNEWAEGNYIEPDLEHGHGYLEALADSLTSHIRAGSREPAYEP
jgi:hypothetical protein